MRKSTLVFVLLCLIGLADAAYLTWDHFQAVADPEFAGGLCAMGGGCDISRFDAASAIPLGSLGPKLPISILAVGFYFVAVQYIVMRAPASAPVSPRMPIRERLRAIARGWGVFALAVVVMGGIYSGVFTVNEAAAIGVVIAFVFALVRGRLTRQTALHVLAEASSATAMVYIMVFGATIFSYFIAVSGGAAFLVDSIAHLPVPPVMVIFGLLLLYIFLGAFFDEVAAMVVTLPFVIPIVTGLGYDLVWWGIINVVVIGIGMLSPPLGINVMLLNSMHRDVSLSTIYRGVTPVMIADLLRLILLVLVPALTLWLPSL